ERDQPVAVEIEAESISGREPDRAERRRDGAAIAHAGRDQRRKAAIRRRDRSQVDDRSVGPARYLEVEAAGHEVFIPDIARRREETSCGDHRTGAEDDAVAVDDEDLAVRLERAEDLARAEAAGDAIEHDRIRVRLDERGFLAGADVEHPPVDDG